MSYFLFFSYATGDDPDATRQKREFYDDLIAQVSKHRDFKAPARTVGFLDADMATGSEWEPELAAALKTCRVFVYLQEQAYFNFKQRPWCGREWQVFRSRLDEYVRALPAGVERPPLMIPVVWQLVARPPEAVAAIQFQHRLLGDAYPQLGVYAMKSRPATTVAYTDLLVKLADHIVCVTNSHTLAPLAGLPRFHDIPDPFAPRVEAQAKPRAATEGGPRCVDFVYVVASRNEIMGLRTVIDAYDANGDARLWRPYFPPTDDYIARMAEMLAHKKNLLPSRIDFGADLINRLQTAQDAHRIVVLITDPWTLRVPQYNAIMTAYGARNFWNAVVVVPWNEDNESRQEAATLEGIVKQVFFGLPADAVRSHIRSSKEFVKQLDKALLATRKKIEAYAEFRPVAGAGPRSVPGF